MYKRFVSLLISHLQKLKTIRDNENSIVFSGRLLKGPQRINFLISVDVHYSYMAIQ